MAIELGADPDELTIGGLYRGAHWQSTLENQDEDWPTDLNLILQIGELIFVATKNGRDATFSMTPEDIEALVAQRSLKSVLWIDQGGLKLPWAVGRVRIRG